MAVIRVQSQEFSQNSGTVPELLRTFSQGLYCATETTHKPERRGLLSEHLAQEFFDGQGQLLTPLGELGSVGIEFGRVLEPLIELQ